MIIDGLLQFDPALSAITVTRASTNTIDLLNARNIGGPSSPAMWLLTLGLTQPSPPVALQPSRSATGLGR